ncbi:MAG: DUF2339 domain-containing protein, partial [Opitutaceae bacterium]|nr:DUF2339 domain-containing protein [Opitutaceae bacterium]
MNVRYDVELLKKRLGYLEDNLAEAKRRLAELEAHCTAETVGETSRQAGQVKHPGEIVGVIAVAGAGVAGAGAVAGAAGAKKRPATIPTPLPPIQPQPLQPLQPPPQPQPQPPPLPLPMPVPPMPVPPFSPLPAFVPAPAPMTEEPPPLPFSPFSSPAPSPSPRPPLYSSPAPAPASSPAPSPSSVPSPASSPRSPQFASPPSPPLPPSFSAFSEPAPRPAQPAWKPWLQALQLWPPSPDEENGGDGGTTSAEVRLGAWWTTRIGALLAVIGVAFFGAYISINTPPAVKFAELLFVSLGVTAGGLWLERKIPKFGAVVSGAGLALLYFCAFAAYALPAVKVINNPAVATGWQLLAALLMAAVAVWRRSSLVATMATILALASAVFAQARGLPDFALVTAALLAVAGVAFHRWKSWEGPSVVAMPGVYAVYALVWHGSWLPLVRGALPGGEWWGVEAAGAAGVAGGAGGGGGGGAGGPGGGWP